MGGVPQPVEYGARFDQVCQVLALVHLLRIMVLATSQLVGALHDRVTTRTGAHAACGRSFHTPFTLNVQVRRVIPEVHRSCAGYGMYITVVCSLKRPCDMDICGTADTLPQEHCAMDLACCDLFCQTCRFHGLVKGPITSLHDSLPCQSCTVLISQMQC